MSFRIRLGGACMLAALAACSVKPQTFTPLGGAGDAGLDGDGPPGGNAAPGDVIWARSMSAMATYRVKLGPAGLVAGGSFNAPAMLGSKVYTPVGDYDMAVAWLDPGTGAVRDAISFGSTGYEAAFVDTLDAAGVPIVQGITSGTCDIGTGPLAGGGGSDTFIGRYDLGPPTWTHRLATAEEDKIIATAPGPNNTVYATGYFVGSATIDTTTLTGAGGRDGMLLRFDAATGALQLATRFGGEGRNEGGSLVTQGGDTYLVGLFDGTMQLGSTALESAGGLDAFVARLDGNGQFVWARRIGGPGNEQSPLVAIDAAGDLYITGTYQSEVSFGPSLLLSSVGSDDIYLAKLQGSDGATVWATSIGAAGSDNVIGLAVDPAGRAIVTGNASGALDIGGGNQGGLDAFLASYASDGQLRWKRVIGTPADDRGWGATFGSDGMIYASVTVAGPIDLGVALLGPANPVGVVLKIAP